MNFAVDDELDQFFPDEAVDEFVKGINVDFGTTDQLLMAKLEKCKNSKEEKEVMAAMMVDDDAMMRNAIFGE
jgi:hypothetical protein